MYSSTLSFSLCIPSRPPPLRSIVALKYLRTRILGTDAILTRLQSVVKIRVMLARACAVVAFRLSHSTRQNDLILIETEGCGRAVKRFSFGNVKSYISDERPFRCV